MTEMDGYWEALAEPWLRNEALMERLLAPVGSALDAALDLQSGEAVLDIGPGSGASLLQYREAVGPDGRVTGIDIAPPFADRARARSGCEVIVADAGRAPVEEGAFDAVASQFGVMFFDEPEAAFAVIRQNLRPGGRLVAAAWGPRPENPLFTVPARVAAELLGAPEPTDPDAPGPFGLQNAARTKTILEAAGFVEVRAQKVALALATGLEPEAFARVQADVGPAAGRLREAGGGPALEADLVGRLTAAYAEFDIGGRVTLPALVTLYSGVRPG